MYIKYLVGLTILILVTIFFLYYNNFTGNFEHFDISPVNSFNVNENKLDIHKINEESKQQYISNILKEWSGSSQLKPVENKINAKDFVFKKLFETVVKEEFNKKFNKQKIDVSEIEAIGFYNETNGIIYNFDINLIDRENMWIIPIKVWLKFSTTNICSQVDNCVELITQQLANNLIKMDILKQNCILEFILLNEFKKYNIEPAHYGDNYFQIKNKLYLTEPFLTSGDEMRLKNIDNK